MPFFYSFSLFDHFSVMCAINATTVKHSEVQFRSQQSDLVASSSCSAPSRSALSTTAPSPSMSVVSLGDIMAQLQRIDARLDTLSIELYQVNVRVGHIAWWQVIMGGFASKASPPPLPVASDFEDEDEDEDDGNGDDDDVSDDDDGDASSANEMST